MTGSRTIRAGAVALAAWLSGGQLAAQQPPPNIPADIFTRPSGPHPVGTYDWLWVDSSRAERQTRDPNDKRHLPVQVWYPAEPVPNATPALYIRTPAEFGAAGFKNWERKMKVVAGSNIHLNAEMEKSPNP